MMKLKIKTIVIAALFASASTCMAAPSSAYNIVEGMNHYNEATIAEMKTSNRYQLKQKKIAMESNINFLIDYGLKDYWYDFLDSELLQTKSEIELLLKASGGSDFILNDEATIKKRCDFVYKNFSHSKDTPYFIFGVKEWQINEKNKNDVKEALELCPNVTYYQLFAIAEYKSGLSNHSKSFEKFYNSDKKIEFRQISKEAQEAFYAIRSKYD